MNIEEILKSHRDWLNDISGGVRANLRGADLSGAKLRGADLRGADLRGADLCMADLSDANLSDANLSDANLSDANMRWANLLGANLLGANLRCASLWDTVGNRQQVISLFLFDEYSVVYTKEFLQIGCKRHEIKKWMEFDDRAILEMDGKKALKFWNENKEFIFNTIKMKPAI
jgi:hypothetical protein